jgi:hypothetical protein
VPAPITVRRNGNRKRDQRTLDPLPFGFFFTSRQVTTAGVKSLADQRDDLSGMTISRSLVSTTKTASSFAGAEVLAFWLTW